LCIASYHCERRKIGGRPAIRAEGEKLRERNLLIVEEKERAADVAEEYRIA